MVVQCPFCGAQSIAGVAPHGEKSPCPLQAGILEAQKNLLIAQTDATKANQRNR